MSTPRIDEGRDLRVPSSVGAAVRLGLAEIVDRMAKSTPLSSEQAVGHVQYELNVLKGNYSKSAEAMDGKGSE